MIDSDIFFRLTADTKNLPAQNAIRLPNNRRWLPLGKETTEECGSHSRDTTPAPVPLNENEEINGDALVVRFSTLIHARNSGTLPPFNRGLVFGTDPKTCHVLLPRGPGISAKHCGLGVDQNLRLFLLDFSRFGTAVRCNDLNEDQVRKNYRWVLTKRVKDERLFRDIVICINQLKLEIDFSSHETTSPQYERNLQAFLKILEEDADSLCSLRIDSLATTIAPSGNASPPPAAIYYQLHRLGQGMFASVYQAIQAHSGDPFAMKVFTGAEKRRSNAQQPKWLEDVRREFALMRTNRHPNVVEVIDFVQREHSLAIVMEYYPNGNIGDVQLSEVAYMSAAGQLLDGLQHLHSHGVTHRDLKPANILVRLSPFKVVIADFGLSKIAISPSSLKTFCGSLKYAAPEVFRMCGYGTKADMWSWGVMVYHWMYKGPKEPKPPTNEKDLPTWSETWSSRLHNAVDDQEECKLVTLLSHTIAKRLERRWTARECLEFGFTDPPLFKRRKNDNVVICVDAVEDTCVLRDNNSTTEQIPPMTGHPAEQLGQYPQVLPTSTLQSHLSSRSVIHQETFVYMVIRRQRVSMRKSNHDLNASEILSSAKVDRKCRRHYLEIFKRRGVGAFDGKPLLLWSGEDISYLTHNYLLQKGRRKPTVLPPGFASLMCGSYEVVYKPTEQLVNARHLVNMSDYMPSKLQQLLKHRTAECVKFGGHQKLQGTYVPFALARQLCQDLGLFHQSLQDLLVQGADVPGSANRDHERTGQNEEGPEDHFFLETAGAADDGGGETQVHNDDVVDYFWSPSFQAFLGLPDTQESIIEGLLKIKRYEKGYRITENECTIDLADDFVLLKFVNLHQTDILR